MADTGDQDDKADDDRPNEQKVHDVNDLTARTSAHIAVTDRSVIFGAVVDLGLHVQHGTPLDSQEDVDDGVDDWDAADVGLTEAARYAPSQTAHRPYITR